MISLTTLAAAAKVAQHSARRSPLSGASETPSLAQRVLGAPVAGSQDPIAVAGGLSIPGREPRAAFNQQPSS